jgi:hypothetical protein
MGRNEAPPAETGRGRQIKRSRRTTRTTGNGSSRRQSDTSAVPKLGTRIEYRESCCDAAGDATYTKTYNGDDWLIGSRSLRCPGGGRCLSRLGVALGIGEGATKEQIVSTLKARGRRTRRGDAKPLPSVAQVNEWHDRLTATTGPLRYLTKRRGLSLEVIEAARIGWDGSRLIFPMWDGPDSLALVKTRAPRSGAQMRSWPGQGREWPLYPADVPADWVLLVAGEMDALRARSADLPGVSVTCGAGYWRDEWSAELMGRRVVVCFDNNELKQARECAERLRADGIDATRLLLRKLGLAKAKGDLSDYLNGGGSAAAISAAHTQMDPNIVSLNRSSAGRGDGDR